MIDPTLVSIIDQQQQEIARLNKQLSNKFEEVDSLIDTLRNFTKSDVYAAQNELELLRTIRKSQGEAILKLRRELNCALESLKHSDSALAHIRVERNEACQERDAASTRANGWRDKAWQTEQEVEHLKKEVSVQKCCRNKNADDRDQALAERDIAREALKMSHEVSKLWQSEALEHRHLEMMVRHGYVNPRLEAMLEESYRNEFKRNIDNQKSTDGANCPSS